MKIKRVEAIAIGVPMVKPLKMSFEEVRAANNVLVRVETAAQLCPRLAITVSDD